MFIGIDFDNTIVCYDGIFHSVALNEGFIPSHVRKEKLAVFQYLISDGKEDVWTELQGLVYGKKMGDAKPFKGAREFILACKERGVPVAIVSHKSQFPHMGPKYNLHQAARSWLHEHRFYDDVIDEEFVFFEETLEKKLARIAKLSCSHFIDDLPKVLTAPSFPSEIERILFSKIIYKGPFRCFSNWQKIQENLLN